MGSRHVAAILRDLIKGKIMIVWWWVCILRHSFPLVRSFAKDHRARWRRRRRRARRDVAGGKGRPEGVLIFCCSPQEEMGRGDRRRRPQWADLGRLSRAGGTWGGRPREASRHRRRRRDGGDCSGFPLLSLQLPPEPPPPCAHSVSAHLCSLRRHRFSAVLLLTLYCLLGEKRELELGRHGLKLLKRNPSSFTPCLDGRYLLLGPDSDMNQSEISKFSARDALSYPRYHDCPQCTMQGPWSEAFWIIFFPHLSCSDMRSSWKSFPFSWILSWIRRLPKSTVTICPSRLGWKISYRSPPSGSAA